MLLTTRRQEVRFVFWPPRRPTGHRRIRMFDRQGYDIGTLVWMVCDTCRVGSINKISISDPPGACRRARPPLADHRPVPRGEAILPRHGEGDRHRVPRVRRGLRALRPAARLPATPARTPSAAPATSSPPLPAGVKCSGKACTGQDPEAMGCGGEFAKTVSRVTVGKALVEVRYSKTCQAAWARITQAAPGDTVQISVGGKGAQEGLVNADNDAYTPMTAVATQTGAKACATLRTGTTGCTAQQ
ncbi:YjfA family protein [Streptomyces lunaelactis]|nr:YjfA family protein [Streptomyces lunaelactis]